MLPIANRKTLEIPHGLAALAAVICLVLAFMTDYSSVEQSRHAEQTGQAGQTTPVEQVAEENGTISNAQPAKRERRDRRERQGSLTLLPWFPVPGGGR